jgi:hypothetical protein
VAIIFSSFYLFTLLGDKKSTTSYQSDKLTPFNRKEFVIACFGAPPCTTTKFISQVAGQVGVAFGISG